MTQLQHGKRQLPELVIFLPVSIKSSPVLVACAVKIQAQGRKHRQVHSLPVLASAFCHAAYIFYTNDLIKETFLRFFSK